MDAYAAKFENLAKYFRFLQVQPDEGWKCERFEGGLCYEIKEVISSLEIRQFQPLVENAANLKF